MKRHDGINNPLIKRLGRSIFNERGTSTIEWVSLTAVLAVLMISVIAYVDAVNGGPVGGAINDVMGRMVLSYEGGGSAGGSVPGGGNVPGISAPQISSPNVSVPDIAVQSVGVPSAVADLVEGNEGDDSGGFWSWVGDAWDSFTGAVGDLAQGAWEGFTGVVGAISEGISNAWNGLVEVTTSVVQGIADWWNSEGANWVKGLLVGILGALVVVAAIAGLVVLGLIAVKVGIVLGAIALIAGAAFGVWYGLTQVQGIFSGSDFQSVFIGSMLFSALAAWSAGSLLYLSGGLSTVSVTMAGFNIWFKAGSLTAIANFLVDSTVRLVTGQEITITSIVSSLVLGFMAGAIEAGLAARLIRGLAQAPALTGFAAFLNKITLGLVGATYRFLFKAKEIVKFIGRSIAFTGLSGVLGILVAGASDVISGSEFGAGDVAIAFILGSIAGIVAIPVILANVNKIRTLATEIGKSIIISLRGLFGGNQPAPNPEPSNPPGGD